MAFFNFIETFFFISLGITFVLILLLVYHFKQRMTGLEQKCDTMFEIINDVVKELNVMRNRPSFFQPMQNFIPPFNVNDVLNRNFSTDNNDDNNDDDDNDDDNDDESEESSDVGNSDEDEDEDEDEYQNETENENIVSEINEIENDNAVKIISVNKETLIDLDVEQISTNNEEIENDESEEDDELSTSEEIVQPSTETILVEKIESLEEVEPNDLSTDNKDVYKKMSLGALKALVISKGLCSDARTMRKNDLLKLLEDE
jgi:hypothetical protein